MLRIAGGLIFVLAVLAWCGWLYMSQAGPGSDAPPPAKPSSGFAADRDARASNFDPKRAMGYLAEVCRIGPRISGSDGMKKQQELLQKHFESHGGTVELQRFSARQKSQRQPVEMANLIAAWHPERGRRVIICAHYDTRPIADQEPDPRKWRQPFLSANDGGSGVAFLMEFAHHLKDLKTSVGIDFVLFDGEEYIFEPGEEGDLYFFGSQHFATQYRQNKIRNRPRYQAAVLLDMIAGKNARFPIEQHSWAKAGPLVQDLWNIAAQERCPAFVNQLGDAVRDDHLALNQVGIPAVDIIDFDYPHWHRLTDIPENCSGDTMSQVARVLTVWLQRLK